MKWSIENIPTIQLYLSSGFKDENVGILLIDTKKAGLYVKVKEKLSV
jgi:hypothetical protein